MVELILNEDHLGRVLVRALELCRHRLFVATADVKDVHVPVSGAGRRGRSRSIFTILTEMAGRGVEVAILHGAIPSGPVIERLRGGLPPGFLMRRCPRVHTKAVIVDSRHAYLGSANLTGAGIGAKGRTRRNSEAGVWTDEVALVDPLADMLAEIWTGGWCEGCGRRDVCPEPLEEPDLKVRP